MPEPPKVVEEADPWDPTYYRVVADTQHDVGILRAELRDCVRDAEAALRTVKPLVTLLEEATRWDSNHCYCIEFTEDELGGPKCLHCRITDALAQYEANRP